MTRAVTSALQNGAYVFRHHTVQGPQRGFRRADALSPPLREGRPASGDSRADAEVTQRSRVRDSDRQHSP